MAVSRSVRWHREFERWKRPVLGLLVVLFGMALQVTALIVDTTPILVWSPSSLIVFGICVVLEIPVRQQRRANTS